METKIDGRDGWIEVTRAGVSVLTKGDDALRERVESAVGAAAADESLADVVTDELTRGGVRRTPDFAIVDEVAGRVLVRGTARVQVTDATGDAREIGAPARGPWADEDLTEGTRSVVLETGEPEPVPTGPQVDENGWAMPSVFGAAGAPADAGPEPASLDEPVPAASSEGEPDADELPEYDVLFAGADQARGAEGYLPDEASEAPVDSGPVAAAGGYQVPEDPTNATLAPPSEEEQDEPPVFTGTDDGSPVATDEGSPSGAPDTASSEAAGSAGPEGEGATDPDAAGADSLGGAAVAGGAAAGTGALLAAGDGDEAEAGRPAGDDGAGVAPEAGVAGDEGERQVGADGAAVPVSDSAPGVVTEEASEAGPERPGFVDGHLVSSRAVGPDAGVSDQPEEESGVEVPSADAGPAAATVPTSVDNTGELPAGPVVLAVRCATGHYSAPHATRCRVCGQELPTQQPEPTLRPPLGLLRISTGDVVTLDRGVLVGRAPRSPQEADGADAPHLLRVASPDNEISRNHVEVVLDGWHVLVRDLGSTNGTTVTLPGSTPVRVRPDDQQSIEPGTTITLADQVSMVFEVTG